MAKKAANSFAIYPINGPINGKRLTLSLLIYLLTVAPSGLQAMEQGETQVAPPPTQALPQAEPASLPASLTDAIDALGKDDTTEAMQNLFFAYTKQLQGLEFIIEQLALAVSQKKMGLPELMDDVHTWLASVKDIVMQARQVPVARLTPDVLIARFQVVEKISSILSRSIDTQFQWLPPLDYESLYLFTKLGATLSQALFFAQKTENLVSALNQKATDAGLSWFNKTYSIFSGFLHRTALVETTAKTAAIGTVAFFSYLLYAPEHWITNPALKTLRTNCKAKINTLFSAENMDSAQKTIGAIAALVALNQQLGLLDQLKAAAYAVDAKLRGVSLNTPATTAILQDDGTDPSAPDLSSPLFNYLGDDLAPLREIVAYLGNPAKYSTIKIEKGILLTGKPGSGKTFTAKAFINSCKKAAGRTAVISVNSSALIASNGFESIIAQAKALAPCVIFIDEGHTLTGGLQLDKNWAMLEDFLLALDAIDRDNDPQHQVWVIVATNRPDLLNEPLRRPGRLGLQIEFFEPSFEHRKQILDTLCKKAGIHAKKINSELFAHLTKGASVSALNKLVEGASRRAKLRNEPVSFDDMYESLNNGFRHLHRSIALTQQERAIVAAHLAGIVVARINLTLSTKLESVTIRAPQQNISEQYDWQAKIEQNERTFFKPLYGTFFTYAENELIIPNQDTDSLAYAECKAILAGTAAEKILLGTTSSYDQTAFQRAYEVMLSEMTKKIALEKLPKKLSDALKLEAWNKVQECEKQVAELLNAHKEELVRISDQLKKDKDFLRIDEIQELLKVEPVKPVLTPAVTPAT
ncbi:MAG: ATP-dependent zinc metalloprotease FtsH [candidate division TM6 bacterium GW2011_GWE2_42_60]|nr:MAG: ATP-dependent zinc metalloprotease FtsH [candidate division TM6 bacterium GW2011_GWE2_42_60]HBY06208.1 hypothetical protein [Candidatus Dependentiae bacterium]